MKTGLSLTLVVFVLDHTGAVYLSGDWLTEAAALDEVLMPAGSAPDGSSVRPI